MEWISPSQGRLDLCLSVQLNRSRSFAKYQINRGGVRVNGKTVEKPSYAVRAGDNIQVEVKEEPALQLVPVEKPLDILYEDASLLVINKPQGWVVHPASGHKGETLVHYLLHHFQDASFQETSSLRPGIVHRLDRGTSGCIIVARNRPALESLSAQFKDRAIEKEYEAIVWGQMKEQGRFTGNIARHTTDRKRMTTRKQGGREAMTDWKKNFQSKHFTHVRLFPKTGRTHQLRVHLAEAGFPIVADKTYCRKSRDRVKLDPKIRDVLNGAEYPFLHARRIAFFHPVTKERIECVASRPNNFQQLLDLIEGYDHAIQNNHDPLGI